jgi:hypothetical protein
MNLLTEGSGLIARWAQLYSDQKMVSAGVTYVHLAGILLGGGLAVASDRASLQLDPDSSVNVSQQLDQLYQVHRLVVLGLAITIASGLLMLLADLQTFLPSILYWTKMSLVVLLLGNGYVRLRAERALREGREAWTLFRRTSVASLGLWFLILLAGAFLTTVS